MELPWINKDAKEVKDYFEEFKSKERSIKSYGRPVYVKYLFMKKEVFLLGCFKEDYMHPNNQQVGGLGTAFLGKWEKHGDSGLYVRGHRNVLGFSLALMQQDSRNGLNNIDWFYNLPVPNYCYNLPNPKK